MNDQRLKVFRGGLGALSEPLQAQVRVPRWTEVEAPPEPLRTAAAKLLDRLGSAGRLSAGTFVGTPAATTKVDAMFTAMSRRDGAYVSYRKRVESPPPQSRDAASTLEAEITDAPSGAAARAYNQLSRPPS